MGIAHYEGARLRPRTNIEDVSSASQNGVALSSSIFRRLVTRENCQDTDSCAAASANTNLVVPIVVAIVYATNYAFVFSVSDGQLDRGMLTMLCVGFLSF